MFARVLIGLTLVAGALPLSVLAQEDGTTDEQLVGEVVVEESEPVSREQAQDNLDAAIEQNPEAAVFGLETAREAVTQGGVDGQAVSETASDGRASGNLGAAPGHSSESAAGASGSGVGNAEAAGNGGAAGTGGNGGGAGGAGGRN
ncbi:hypothetical protein OCT51_14080 [Halomonas sp. LR3S48]|uniref:hypothetical protein n=1 Tax=Halomonadaceae TaxID=28256 RepID=UPI0021E4335C|nr:hypothetical protein [Halomonas sp. LR3S48]UYG02318.1 hypothetical protein OCT51_14080 [Halomonas sp. LR3S48]